MESAAWISNSLSMSILSGLYGISSSTKLCKQVQFLVL